MADEFELQLTGMAHGGSAVGRRDGKTVFVPYAIPGEHITAQITQDKERFAHAEIVSIDQASPARVTPRCKHFGVCGGCHWQHIDYPAQLEFKRQIIIDQLRRIGGIADAEVHPTFGSTDAWHYRTHVSAHTADDGRLGYIARNRRPFAVEECHIVRPELLDLLLNTPSQPGVKRLRLQLGGNPAEHFVSAGIDEGDTELDAQGVGGEFVSYTIKERRFRVSAGSFFQVNLPQAAALVEFVLERLALTGGERILDLYAGVGLFSAFMAQQAAHVTLIENSPTAVQDALHNLADFENVTVLEGTVEAALDAAEKIVDAAVIDPPRTGMKPAALNRLLAKRPRRIIYVSCDPATLARDAKALIEGGYHLIDVQPVDMFPQTYHVEAVAWFMRN